jgi:hypothetical protein
VESLALIIQNKKGLIKSKRNKNLPYHLKGKIQNQRLLKKRKKCKLFKLEDHQLVISHRNKRQKFLNKQKY